MTAAMTTEGLKQRHPPSSVPVIQKLRTERLGQSTEGTPHPGGEIKHGAFQQGLRMFLFAVYFIGSILAWVTLFADGQSQHTNAMLQHRRHTIYRRPAVLLQQGPVLRLDGYDEAALWHRYHHNDLLVGARQDKG